MNPVGLSSYGDSCQSWLVPQPECAAALFPLYVWACLSFSLDAYCLVLFSAALSSMAYLGFCAWVLYQPLVS